MKKFSYGKFRIFDYKEMADYFMEGTESGQKCELSNVMPNNVDVTEVDLLKLRIELLRQGFELDLVENNNGNSYIADKAYSHYLLTLTPKLEEFFKLISTDSDYKDIQSDNQVEKYRHIISNITDKIKNAYGDFNLKTELHKEKLNRYQRSMSENKGILSEITQRCEDEIMEFDKKLKAEQLKLSNQ